MMHKWEYSDGTVVRWTSKGSILVGGESGFAKNLRHAFANDLATLTFGLEPSVTRVPVDSTSIWLVNQYIEHYAFEYWYRFARENDEGFDLLREEYIKVDDRFDTLYGDDYDDDELLAAYEEAEKAFPHLVCFEKQRILYLVSSTYTPSDDDIPHDIAETVIYWRDAPDQPDYFVDSEGNQKLTVH